MAFRNDPPKLEILAKLRIIHQLWWNEMNVEHCTRCSDVQVAKNALHLGLPNALANRLALGSDVRVVRKNFEKWFEKHECLEDIPLPILRTCLKFNAYGHIDELETVKLVVSNERVAANVRYELAVQYCMEEEIYHLYSPKNARGHLDIAASNHRFLHSFWSNRLRGNLRNFWASYVKSKDWVWTKYLDEHDPEESFNQLACFEAAMHGPPQAVQFFWKSLTLDERVIQFKEACNMWNFMNTDMNSNIFFMVRDLWSSEKKDCLKDHPFNVLNACQYQPMEWLEQVANFLWNVTSFEEFNHLMLYADTEELFIWLWNAAPQSLRDEALNDQSISITMIVQVLFRKWRRAANMVRVAYEDISLVPATVSSLAEPALIIDDDFDQVLLRLFNGDGNQLRQLSEAIVNEESEMDPDNQQFFRRHIENLRMRLA